MFTGEKVYLRPYEKGDVDSILNYMNDDDVRRFLMPGIPFPYSKAEEEEWLESQKKVSECKNFAVIDKESGEYLGGCGINTLDWKNNLCYIGIFLGKPHWSKGYGYDAMKILCDFVFDQMNLRKILLNVYSFNERAIGCYKKIGFKEEGRLRKQIFRDGTFHDEIIMGFFREER